MVGPVLLHALRMLLVVDDVFVVVEDDEEEELALGHCDDDMILEVLAPDDEIDWDDGQHMLVVAGNEFEDDDEMTHDDLRRHGFGYS